VIIYVSGRARAAFQPGCRSSCTVAPRFRSSAATAGLRLSWPHSLRTCSLDVGFREVRRSPGRVQSLIGQILTVGNSGFGAI